MNLDTFFEKFELFADAPGAVAKMRELVLEIAVQGKLVDQDPSEGDGHALLSQIHEKNPPLGKDTEDELSNAELPSFPISWAPSKLGEVAEIVRGVSFPGSAKSETRSDGDVACLRTASVQAEIDWDDLIFISPAHVSRTDQWVGPNDIMISMANSYALVGKVAIVRTVPQKATFGAFLAAIRPILIDPYFLLYVLRSPRMQAAFRASSSQTTNIANISLGRMRPLPFPLPPLAEQKRIVAKVDELMALCDRLEAQQQERETRHAALARASLSRFAEAPTPADLDFLFHKSYTIDPADLRKSILTLAVQGKLMPQDADDEPAISTLEEIEAEKTALIELRKLRPNRVTEITQARLLQYDVPDSWRWFRLGDVAFFQEGPGIRNWQFRTEGTKLLNVQNIVDGRLVLENSTRYISNEEFEQTYNHFAVETGDILFASSGASWGKAAWFIDPGYTVMLNTSMIRLKFYSRRFDDAYLLLFLRTEFFKAQMEIQLVGIQPNFGSTHLGRVYIPIPPLAEQRRIVAKVDQLMALVDQLETQLAASRVVAEKLLEALVAELTANGP